MSEQTAQLITAIIIAAFVGLGVGYSVGKMAWQSDKAKALEEAAKKKDK